MLGVMLGQHEGQPELEAKTALSSMILSPSGWRGVFAATGGEEDATPEIGGGHRIVVAGAAAAFAKFLQKQTGGGSPVALVGMDTRPTSRVIADVLVPALLASGCKVRFAGYVAAPEIMAWARAGVGDETRGFVYISASHNPIGHNGLKFGLADGGVLPLEEAATLAQDFRELMAAPGAAARLEELAVFVDLAALEETLAGEKAAKKEALDAYYAFSEEVAWGGWDAKKAFLEGVRHNPLGVCCDFNGSARCVSIDRAFFTNLEMNFAGLHSHPGEIKHAIVPEGASLNPCCDLLNDTRFVDPAFALGYVPDCDGDRGNVVVWDEALGRARALEAQEVFALACVAELAHLAWAAGGKLPPKVAIAANDPTSFRVDRIAELFGAEVFRAEVGEANVVGLARRLREKGYTVRILGEGSAGGTITHPSAVRDPLHTVLALAKLLSMRTEAGGARNSGGGLFDLWCRASGQERLYRPNFTIADIIASLPPFVTTGAYAPEALLKIASEDHGALKSRYQRVFLREWDERKSELKTRFGIYGWDAIAYNGEEERGNLGDFGEAGKGGLKVRFLGEDGKAVASLWMRGSATEPVFRVMADAEIAERDGVWACAERDLIEWQRRMVTEADG